MSATIIDTAPPELKTEIRDGPYSLVAVQLIVPLDAYHVPISNWAGSKMLARLLTHELADCGLDPENPPTEFGTLTTGCLAAWVKQPREAAQIIRRLLLDLDLWDWATLWVEDKSEGIARCVHNNFPIPHQDIVSGDYFRRLFQTAIESGLREMEVARTRRQTELHAPTIQKLLDTHPIFQPNP